MADNHGNGELAIGNAPVAAGTSVVPPKTRILFVDDESAMLRMLRLGMRSMAAAWDMEFANDGEAALALIDQQPFDVVVTDMRMSGINGAQLLNQVLRRHPQTVRIILSGYSDLAEVVSCAGITHQFLVKPCGLDDLKNCLKKVTLVKSRLVSEPICTLVGGLRNLPSLPALYLEIADALQSPSASAQRIAELAAQDAGLSAKLLQLANSGYFGRSCEVYSMAEAVQLLGVTAIQSLAMATPIFSAFRHDRCPGFPLDRIWEHSLQTALLARQLAHEISTDPQFAEQAFCAGLLHDVGKIILADGLAEQYQIVWQEARQTAAPLFAAERARLHATHAETGAYLLALWGLPIRLVEAVANHHQPAHCGAHEFHLAGVVHVANALQHLQNAAPETGPATVDTEYLQNIGFTEQFAIWRETLTVEAN